MPKTQRFDYEAALRQLMELRFAARSSGQELSEVGRWLERRIHAHVLYPHDDAGAVAEPGDGAPGKRAA